MINTAINAGINAVMHPGSFWAPNLHPLFVHLPIGLLVAAVVVDAIGFILGCNSWLRGHATALYVLGTLTGLATYYTGRDAARTVWLPGMAQALVKDHWDWAFRTIWFFGILTIARLVLLRPARRTAGGTAKGNVRPVVVASLVLAGLVGLALLAETSDRGGRLVYTFGVATTRD